jgi:hypothetical protein
MGKQRERERERERERLNYVAYLDQRRSMEE